MAKSCKNMPKSMAKSCIDIEIQQVTKTTTIINALTRIMAAMIVERDLAMK